MYTVPPECCRDSYIQAYGHHYLHSLKVSAGHVEKVFRIDETLRQTRLAPTPHASVHYIIEQRSKLKRINISHKQSDEHNLQTVCC